MKKINPETTLPITLIPAFKEISAVELQTQYHHEHVFACDFYITAIEKQQEIAGGYAIENITNIDHHAPTERMMTFVTSTQLAINYIQTYGPIPQDAIVLINHTDCDSILSSLILCGHFLAKELFAQAALAADHTGQTNDIADLLQALASTRDVPFSIRNLEQLLNNKKLEQTAEMLLQKRHAERIFARTFIEEGGVEQIGHVAFLKFSNDQDVDSPTLLPLLPLAEIILVARPMPNDTSRLGISVMRGNAAGRNVCINKIGLPDEFGGRWNAGSNKRSGGTTRSPHEYIDIINAYIDALKA
jgi:hypothetical protein